VKFLAYVTGFHNERNVWNIVRLDFPNLISITLKLFCLNDNHLNTGVWQNLEINRSFATTVSQFKISDFSGHHFKGFEVP
jgi:hypothetical protein